MATLEWTYETVDGVTLVELVVTVETAQRVCIESNLQPVWPPRRQGQPAAGWKDGRYEEQLEEDGRLAVGYASPAEPVEPPATVRTQSPEAETAIDPCDVVRALGDGTPPRDAVPTDSEPLATSDPDDSQPVAAESQRDSAQTVEREEPRESQQANSPGGDETALPPGIEAYFEALDCRITAAERLAEPETVDQAQTAVTAAGGIRAVGALERQLRADRARLERLSARQRTLADRLNRVEIPIDRLERLA